MEKLKRKGKNIYIDAKREDCEDLDREFERTFFSPLDFDSKYGGKF